MVSVRNVRGGTGLDPIIDEVNEILDAIFSNARRTSEDFFDNFSRDPKPIILAEWLATRAWREIDYVFLLNAEIQRYGMGFERKHVTLLAKQAFQEAEHYELVGNAVESLGGKVPTSVPADSLQWSEFLWDCLDRHPLAAIAAWNASETSATGSLEPTFLAGEQHGFDEVVRVHRKIEIDEKFHVGLGRQILARYARTDEDRKEILRAMRGMHDIALHMFRPETATRLMTPQP
ncbi:MULTISPECIES: hypothetical protein [unclassified Gordonia (in: high G+C Gram-positive bacteria)]|uniref:hypothetical protein n=1 Tax=unclassified Gordonia (in: high G+C Gram-positive bacteria) TaxID=2657482 RepID=UPI0014858DB0|nr:MULTISPECIES: hypothetical protein [unclassified Gordonia (in: high G+C Gram-positive bacteria)]